MAQYSQNRRYAPRRRTKPKKSFKTLVVWIVVIAILGTAAVLFAVSCHSRTAADLLKISYPQKYGEYVSKAAGDYNLPPELIYAVIRTESGFNPDAESSAGARGLMQLMPSSFEWLQEKRGETGKYTSDSLFDPAVNIDYGAYLLRYFYDCYGTEQCAVAAYNAGFVVSDWLADPNYSTDGVTLSSIPYPETSNYVEKVENAKSVYIELYYS